MTEQTIQQLREARGESRIELAQALAVPAATVAEWETGQAEPTVLQFRALTEHFGIAEHQLDVRPGDPPSLGERLGDLL
jgi:transcriptional regulator with XRE-family HTH domain